MFNTIRNFYNANKIPTQGCIFLPLKFLLCFYAHSNWFHLTRSARLSSFPDLHPVPNWILYKTKLHKNCS